ncbi:MULTISPECIES: DUF4442 domain-containing protein [Mesonia]|uniref:Uncharacterized protein n=1 Tax=Mesonia oceanica TaxID=2687242 RepID=A0AC61Y481_9FLAO|nr:MULTISPECIES: DUF4442 domain-containing protein [Mesonia]MAN28030.1 thioesterase [Mesonia sp.]MAQ42439.1 thioesterase [Mesonia sp.]MBJ96745.1 thioesterase [Flavobacteriaceae bacterium]VVU99275.1 hypothetical protein FVB9532_00527 [Mesonia oceanica]|tara:strand:+ start:2332 stop:2787 length:456 start_codon:yes stop_codon:yes gene_type:complete
MKLTPKKINLFTMMKLPAAWFCGVRLKEISEQAAKVTVRHRWINQNPFNSMYFAVQAMAAELSTGALVMQAIQNSNANISMLVAENNAEFFKKATGKITFRCEDGKLIQKKITEAIQTGEGQTCWMKSVGHNGEGVKVAEFNFKWTVKKKG